MNTVLAAFVSSEEFSSFCGTCGITAGSIAVSADDDEVTAFVRRCYLAALDRDAEESGLNYWLGLLKSGDATAEDVAGGIIFSEEARNEEQGEEAFVKLLYRVFMNRNAEEDGLNYWIRVLEAGTSRRNVLADFANSEEFAAIQAAFDLN